MGMWVLSENANGLGAYNFDRYECCPIIMGMLSTGVVREPRWLRGLQLNCFDVRYECYL